MTQVERPPVSDWATDFDHTHGDYAMRAPEIWAELRNSCPVAHTDRFGGAWLPTRHDDVSAIAKNTDQFSSQGVIVTDWRPDVPAPIGYAPPITSDPPFHELARRILLPAFAPKTIEQWAAVARATCHELLDEIEATDDPVTDAAVDYAQHIPVRVIAKMLGLPSEDGDRFRVFIHRILEAPGQSGPIEFEDTLFYYLQQITHQRRNDPGDDLISMLLDQQIEGEPLSADHVVGTISLLLLAGIDTTWSAIGASLWHLAQHPGDRRRWIDEPEIRPLAIEEFLRFYAPVTMARLVSEDTQIGECPVKAGDWTLLSFPAANRDPEAFERADEFVIDRERNRHAAFGLGIHRCIGSNLARMELTVAIEEWMKRFGHFELADPHAVRWATGQVRGPRSLPVRIAADPEAI